MDWRTELNEDPERPAKPVYSDPMLRPCARIVPEATDGIRVGLEDRYRALTRPLPLGGGQVMGTAAGGGIALCDMLRARSPWMEPAIAAIERQLRVASWAGRPWLAWRPICLVGGVGIGKSRLARDLARLSGVGAAALDLGGMHDAGALVAVSRGWTNAKPCWPAEMMAALGCANPILTLDEVEKAGDSRRNGDPQTALLAMLEPSTAADFFDTCLMAGVDLSAVCWICTANSADALPRPLASRLEIVQVDAPDPEHFDLLVEGIMVDLASRWGMRPANMPLLARRPLQVLRTAFSRHRSVRVLQRHVETVVSALVVFPRVGLH